MRQPIYFILLITALFIIGLFPSLSIFAFNEQMKMVVDSSMATILFLGLINAVLLSSYIVYRDSVNGALLLIFSKPVPRSSFILGKLAGILCALTIFVLICSLGTLISLNVAVDQFNFNFMYFYIYFGLLLLGSGLGCLRNYLSSCSFTSNAAIFILILLLLQFLYMHFFTVIGTFKNFRSYELNVVFALILIFFAIWIFGAIAVLGATRLDMVSNLIICFGIFMLGLVSDYFFLESAGTNYIFKLIYAVVPNWQFFWMADALANNRIIPVNYIIWSLFYTVIYIVVCSCFSIFSFAKIEAASSSNKNNN
ncbi:MAG: hypothetical protein GY756_03275 [bacterium]|nr:hypothetical protein [bacterium]